MMGVIKSLVLKYQADGASFFFVEFGCYFCLSLALSVFLKELIWMLLCYVMYVGVVLKLLKDLFGCLASSRSCC